MTEGLNRRKFLHTAGVGAGACLVLGTSAFAAGARSMNPGGFDPGTTPLKTIAARKGLLYGTESTYGELQDAAYADLVSSQCGLLVPGLALKWDALRPTPETYDFSKGDWMLNFTRQRDMKYRGHALVWFAALPKWFNGYATPQNAKQLLLAHINTVVLHYAGKMQSWDVINEALEPNDKRPDGLRNSPWLQLLGPDYIEMAFRAASEADPHAILVWNENFIEEDTAAGIAKRAFFVQHLKRLLGKGVPIHAIGIQSHLIGGNPNIAGPQFQQFIDQVSDMGLKILITELDVKDFKLPNDITARDTAIAGIYTQYLNTVLARKAVVAVLSWGMSDKYTWIEKAYPRPDGAPVRPLAFDANMNPSRTWYALAKAFDSAPSR